MERRATIISLVITKDVKCSNVDIETFKSMSFSIEKYNKPDVEIVKNFLIDKISSLELSRVRLLVENTTYKDFENEKIGQWRLRLDPSIPNYGDFIFNGHSIILDCYRKQKRLSVRRIFLQKVSKRPYPSEGVLSGQILIIRDDTSELPDETYMVDKDFKWMQDLPRRRKDLEERLSQWNEYVATYLVSIENKQAWIAYRYLERISPTRAKIQISTQKHSKNAHKHLYPDDIVSVLREKIPDDSEWKPNEATSDPEQIGTIGTDIRKYITPEDSNEIRDRFESEKNRKSDREEWIDLEIELDDKYIYDFEEYTGNYNEEKIYKDPLYSLPKSGLLVNSIFADQLPLELQEKAINRLKGGNSVNPRLEDFLFDIKMAKEPSRNENISLETLVQNSLNEKQLEALKKSLNSPDISLIQGPPGTGKTTVIAELCHQAVLRGGKVLVASQSNLAVDNALSRLANKSIIMPIRIGKHTTEEGDDFVEENVVQRWFTSVKENTDKVIESQDLLKNDFKDYEDALKDLHTLKNNRGSIKKEIDKRSREIEFFNDEINSKETEKLELSKQINLASYILSILKFIQSYQKYPEKEKFCKFAEIYPDIIDLLNKKLELIFASSRIEFIYNGDKSELGDILSYLRYIIENCVEIKKQIGFLSELLSQLNNSNLNDDEINKLDERRSDILLKMRGVTDKDQFDLLSSELLSINQKIFELQSQYIEEKITDSWKKVVSSSSSELSKLSCFFELTGSRDMKSAIDEINSSLSPEKRYESILIEMLYLFGNLGEDTLKLPASVLDDVEKLEQEYSQKEENTKRIVENLEIELVFLKSKLEDFTQFTESKKEEITSLDIDIESSLKTISKIISSRNLGLKLERESFNPSVLDNNILEFLESGLSELKRVSISELNKSERWLNLQKEWSKRIMSSSTEDYRDLVDIYIDSANVVGATCTETGKYRFWGKEGREFDLAIIDEVSKATPPELLMPMLLGKQIVLVGDHQQLPPTFRLGEGELTIEEIDDKEDIKQRLKNFKELVTTSYFREIFQEASPEIKSRLITQYRMHPTIMNAINQFYPSGYKLECGIKNPDENRRNMYVIEGKEGELSPKNTHLIWVDTSETLVNEKKCRNFEKKEHGKYNSRYNVFEVQVIERILISFNSQFEAIKEINTPAQDIAVISFYAGQVRKLRTMADKLKNSGRLSNIRYRIGTVDRFQGMEKQIVIVSLVSSPYKNGPTSFVKEFRRINVAFSRAQSLLIIVGSKNAFESIDVEIHFDGGEIFRRQSYYEIIKMTESGVNGSCLVKGYDIK